MQRENENALPLDGGAAVLHPDPVEAGERRKARGAGQYTAISAVVLLVIAVVAGIEAFPSIASGAAGIALALFVVALMLMFEGERRARRLERRNGHMQSPAARG